MPKEQRSKLESVGEILLHTAEAAAQSSDPDKKAAAEHWKNIITKGLAAVRPKKSLVAVS